MPLSTVSVVLKRNGMGRLGRIGLEQRCALRALQSGRARPHRHQKARPDRRRRRQTRRRTHRRAATGRAARDAAGRDRGTIGWEFVHVAVDDYSRLAYVEVLDRRESHDRDRASCAGRRLLRPPWHPRRTHPHRQRQRLHRDRCTRSPAAHSASATSAHGPAAHKQTAKPNASSAPCSTAGPTAPSTPQAIERTRALDGWLWHYNHRRRHSALGHQPPVSRTNLLGSYTSRRTA